MKSRRLAYLLASAALIAAAGFTASCQTTASVAQSSPSSDQLAGMRRLSESQYRHTIADIFGSEVSITGRFEPAVRTAGLNAVGAGHASVSAAGMEQYYAMAASIADQALAKDARARVMPCAPAAENAPDDACARAFLTKYGRLLFRRPLTEPELAQRIALARDVGAQRGDFYGGLRESLISLLAAPDFLFRMERGSKAANGDLVLDGYSRASRISYLIWDSAPDAELLDAAQSGVLMTDAGLSAQVDRLLASPRAVDGMTAFFDDMLQLDRLERESKDPLVAPKFGANIVKDAREQTLRTIIQQVVDKNGDYRDLFTTRETVMNRDLALIYRVPFGGRDGWEDYTFAPETHRTGLLTQISFLSLFAHPARSSPTKRGVALNEIFRCQVTPDPPPNVDFSIVTNGGPLLKTLRSRMEAHVTDDVCAGCHTLTDPPGLALEQFDTLGELRAKDNGELIDVRSEWMGKTVNGPEGLGQLLHDDPRTPACLVRNVYAAATGGPVDIDAPQVQALDDGFARSGYHVPALIRAVALDPDLYRVHPVPDAAPVRVAAQTSVEEAQR